MVGVQRIETLEDLQRITFEDGMAAVEAPGDLLDDLPLKNDVRLDSPRLETVLSSIRNRGYDPTSPVIARMGQKGRWVVVDGGHRLTAAKRVNHEFWSNLFGTKVGNVYFLLFTGPRSFRKMASRLGLPEDAGDAPPEAETRH